MTTDEYVPRAATWDEIETGFHEYAADLTKQELEWDGEGPTSFPPEFADWKVGMKAAQKWLAAHDARVRRDAAREALDGLAIDLAVTSGYTEAEEVRDYRDAHYPETGDRA